MITSEEGIIENNNAFSHWTPNLPLWHVLMKAECYKGHSEDNLRQINTFVDFDTLDPNFDYGDFVGKL